VEPELQVWCLAWGMDGHTMLRESRLLLITAAALVLAAQTPQSPTENFIWKAGNHAIGRLSIPKGFSVELYDYREGTVTTLRYRNGAHIVLQVGGMYSLPLYQGPEYKLISLREEESKTTRLGRFADSELRWREDDYKAKKVEGRQFSLLAIWAPNIGYAKVTHDQQAEFDKALDSFTREIDRLAPSK
jgi:hypothetical protein